MAKGVAEEGGQEGPGQGGRVRMHTRAIEEASVCIIPASVYRSGARANQTDIIDLTCDLEIRKITDGERLEPIIIVNIGRPVSRFLAAVAVLALPLILASYISLTWRRCGQQLWHPFYLQSSLPLPWSIFSDICVFLLSLPSFAPCRLPPFPTPFALSIFGYLSPVRPVSRAFIYINFVGFLLFGGFGAPEEI